MNAGMRLIKVGLILISISLGLLIGGTILLAISSMII